ncbi:hypothetical protein [Alteraurantiacibacter buctensis]|uniref:Uncharacterized protein n=1 Tax=Alteraurantiacibacter buctensis TaxID=1503981 RepID=A0A844YZ29_9SPHN|nr:hypothetical protein [Alteraurantiacibacter buctensis]MXO73585.1 hypothetical protein [Alteraurantiacibacter buctensis]
MSEMGVESCRGTEQQADLAFRAEPQTQIWWNSGRQAGPISTAMLYFIKRKVTGFEQGATVTLWRQSGNCAVDRHAQKAPVGRKYLGLLNATANALTGCQGGFRSTAKEQRELDIRGLEAATPSSSRIASFGSPAIAVGTPFDHAPFGAIK